VGKREGKANFLRLRHRCDDISVYLREVEQEGVE
jgi:hypothetical protein